MQNEKLKTTNKKWLLWGLIGFTAILLTTALVLFFQLKKPVALPPPPLPKPTAAPQLPPVQLVVPENVCELSFTVTASPSPSPSPSPEPTVCFDTCVNDVECKTGLICRTVGGDKRCVNPDCTSETDCSCPGVKKTCFDKCESDNDCESSRRCMTIPNTNDKRCVNPSCISESDCNCEQTLVSPSPSPSTIAYASPSPSLIAQTKGGQPELPEAGFAGPAILGVVAGLLMILLGLLF